MKNVLQTIKDMVMQAVGLIVIIWSISMISLVVWRITTPEAIANADVAYWGVITAIITLVTVPIHWWFKRKQIEKHVCKSDKH